MRWSNQGTYGSLWLLAEGTECRLKRSMMLCVPGELEYVIKWWRWILTLSLRWCFSAPSLSGRGCVCCNPLLIPPIFFKAKGLEFFFIDTWVYVGIVDRGWVNWPNDDLSKETKTAPTTTPPPAWERGLRFKARVVLVNFVQEKEIDKIKVS